MTKLAIGLMSGTSADGLTISAVRPHPFKIIAFKNYPYPKNLQQKILQAPRFQAAQISELNFELGLLYAKTLQRFLKEKNISLQEVAVIGSHGQTLIHAPQAPVPHSLQIAEPSFMATKLGIPVVSDFRAKDIALGGQGAPLIPFFDEYIWGKGNPKILLNLGGIANFSIVGKNIKTKGFDVGPGNTLMDLCVQQSLRKPFDKNGSLAAQGSPDKALVSNLLKQPFFKRRPPKSLDKNDFGQAYLTRYFGSFNKKQLPDLLATLAYFTTAAVADQITRFVPRKQQQEIIVSGGGCYNKTVLRFLQELLPQVRVTTSITYGIDPHAKESAAFALFAWLALQKKTNHCPHATGARKATILGKITL
ncbi:MAG: anhydro-N-acetylmuramic acid kinase [Elusimicrobiaceae bacterium]|nr:anhydro-N-acetylmuramic acid kinase [Elusimicrobiaceae bacterium]